MNRDYEIVRDNRRGYYFIRWREHPSPGRWQSVCDGPEFPVTGVVRDFTRQWTARRALRRLQRHHRALDRGLLNTDRDTVVCRDYDVDGGRP